MNLVTLRGGRADPHGSEPTRLWPPTGQSDWRASSSDHNRAARRPNDLPISAHEQSRRAPAGRRRAPCPAYPSDDEARSARTARSSARRGPGAEALPFTSRESQSLVHANHRIAPDPSARRRGKSWLIRDASRVHWGGELHFPAGDGRASLVHAAAPVANRRGA